MPNAVVEKVEPNAKKPEWRTVTAGGKQFIVFSAELADALKVGTPLPEGTTEEPPKFDGALPSLRLPRPGGGGGTAFRNTREGFLLEQEGYYRKDERMDRRTALMQAVAALPPLDVEALATAATYEIRNADNESGPMLSLFLAEQFYRWLRETSGGSPSSASSPEKRSSQREAPPEPTSVGGAAQTRETVSPPKVPGGSSAPTDATSGTGAGEAGTAPEGYGEGSDGAVPSTTELATADDLANAAKHGLTPTKTKAIAASLGITVTKATELTREQLAAVINRYLEVKK